MDAAADLELGGDGAGLRVSLEAGEHNSASIAARAATAAGKQSLTAASNGRSGSMDRSCMKVPGTAEAQAPSATALKFTMLIQVA